MYKSYTIWDANRVFPAFAAVVLDVVDIYELRKEMDIVDIYEFRKEMDLADTNPT